MGGGGVGEGMIGVRGRMDELALGLVKGRGREALGKGKGKGGKGRKGRKVAVAGKARVDIHI